MQHAPRSRTALDPGDKTMATPSQPPKAIYPETLSPNRTIIQFFNPSVKFRFRNVSILPLYCSRQSDLEWHDCCQHYYWHPESWQKCIFRVSFSQHTNPSRASLLSFTCSPSTLQPYDNFISLEVILVTPIYVMHNGLRSKVLTTHSNTEPGADPTNLSAVVHHGI